MALIDELKEKLKAVEAYIEARHSQVREHGAAVEDLERQRWDLDTAIAALQPVELVVTEITKEDAADQLRGEWKEAYSELAIVEKRAAVLTLKMQDIERGLAALEDAAGPEPGDVLFDGTVAGEQEDAVVADAYVAEIISDLTGDPAIEPESGLHEGPVHTDLPQTIAYFINAQGGSVEMRDDGSITPLTAISPLPSQIDQPTTYPDADAAARAMAYYSPAEQRARAAPWPGFGNLFGNKPKVDT